MIDNVIEWQIKKKKKNQAEMKNGHTEQAYISVLKIK